MSLDLIYLLNILNHFIIFWVNLIMNIKRSIIKYKIYNINKVSKLIKIRVIIDKKVCSIIKAINKHFKIKKYFKWNQALYLLMI